MNAISTPDGGSPIVHDFPADETAAPPGDAALGLQLCRASIMSLMRLQLALERGDRMSAMETIDRLHALDVEIERVVADLAGGKDDPRRHRVDQILRDEKMAVAFEKLALAGGIDGPALGSPPFSPSPFSPQGGSLSGGDRDLDLDLDDGPSTGARLFTAVRSYGARLALLLAVAAGTVAMVMMAL